MDRVEDEFRGSGCHTRVFFLFSVCEKEARVPSSVPFACCMPQPKFVPHFAGEGYFR